MKRLRIALLEPWYGGSHRRWADGLMHHSAHEIDLISLPARHWKWRMHGAAVTVAERIIASGKSYDRFLANDLMDVAVFSSLIRQAGITAPIHTYFHENQISYPVSPRDTDVAAARDLHYGFINYTTALASDRVYFNSRYHRESFLSSLPGFLERYPDHQNSETIERISAKSEVLPLGMDLQALDAHKPKGAGEASCPLILWNHRWEYDKCPEAFLQLLLDLHGRGIAFEVALLGERGSEEPELLDQVRRQLGGAVLQDGPVEDFAAYAEWLWRADILPVTGIQDFFGGSVVEAIYTGCHPVLPKRLAYPEHLRDPEAFYSNPEELLEKVASLIVSGKWKYPCCASDSVSRYDWSEMAGLYDPAFSR